VGRSGTEQSGTPEVLAAGGLVWRHGMVPGADGVPEPTIEVVIIHRPRQDDWSFPKGKLDKGETPEQAAVREVEEETGLVCELGEEVESVRYRDRQGRLKEVRYWVMHVARVGTWQPGDEVDRRRWATVADADRLLTYDHDRELLAGLAASLARRDSG
jgi:8-oxo-dGTP diphosphatase